MFARMVWSSLRGRRGRVLMALLAVTVGVAVATTLATLALQVGDDLARTLRAAGPNFVVLPPGARLPLDAGGAVIEPPRLSPALADTSVAALKGGFWKHAVLDAAPELALDATLDGRRVALVGSWFDHTLTVDGEPWRTGLQHLHPSWRLEGRWAGAGAPEVVLGRDVATRVGHHVGDTTVLHTHGRDVRVRVVGLLTAIGPEDARAWTSLESAQAWADRPGQMDRIWVSALVLPAPLRPAPDPTRDSKGYERFVCSPYPEHVANDLHQQLGGADVRPMSELVAAEGVIVGRLHRLMLLLALAALTASALGVFSTSTAGVMERRVELGLLRALGATSQQVMALLVIETLIVAAVGGVLGFFAGVAGAAAIRGQTFGHAVTFPAALLPVAVMLSLLLALAGTAGPLKLALRIDPATVLRG